MVKTVSAVALEGIRIVCEKYKNKPIIENKNILRRRNSPSPYKSCMKLKF
jgi:hypothetical protein